MAITDLPMFQAIRERLHWHSERQQLLAENIANAETPGYRPRDLRAPEVFRVAAAGLPSGGIQPAVTNPGHLAGVSNAAHFAAERVDGYEVTPDGNAVVLEEQMMKVAENQLDYQMATSLYQRSLGILKTAIGRRA